MVTSSLPDRLSSVLRDVPDFPKPGILFKDITPVLAAPSLMRDVIEAMIAPFRDDGVTHVVGVESRGFLFGMPMALAMEVPFSPARKPGKLPWTTAREAYDLEYGSEVLEMHADALGQGGALSPSSGSTGARVLVVDDVLATGGTLNAAISLLQKAGADVRSAACIIELKFLEGRKRLPVPFDSLVQY